MLKCPGWCGECYANRRGRSNKKGHYGYRKYPSIWSGDMGRFIGKPTPSSGASRPASKVVPDDFAKKHPALWEYLTVDSYDDGTAREVATLLLFTEDGLFKACLNDRATSRTCWMSATTVGGLLGLLEEALQGDNAEWRTKREGGPKKR